MEGEQQPFLPQPPTIISHKALLRVTSVACGIQFGWALQVSLLTPYVQELGVSHAWSSIIWLCGPLSGFLVQPLVGHLSDRSTSKYGRRLPFIAIGCGSIILSLLLIGFAADIGGLLGDHGEMKTLAIVVFVLGFWFLDVANNATQAPCRALLADLTGRDHERTRLANAHFSFFTAVGSVLGYATGAYSGWYKLFPFTLNSSCDINCANLKAAFLLDVIIIICTTYISVTAILEQPITSAHDHAIIQDSSDPKEGFFFEMLGTFRYISGSVWLILFVNSLSWIAWFPFVLFDTDWMGREIYGGDPNGDQKYSDGVRMGAFGLLLNSVVHGITSVYIENLCKKWGSEFVWGVSNIVMLLCFLAMLVLSLLATNTDYGSDGLPSNGLVIAALVVFAILGMPLVVGIVPFALVSSHIKSLGLGQGLAMGILNVYSVASQLLTSLGSGPWDQLFGGGNSPAFVVAAVAAFASGLVAILVIPRLKPENPKF